MSTRRSVVVAGMAALLPGTVTLSTGLGVPPNQLAAFSLVAFLVPGLTVAGVFAGRFRVRAIDPQTTRRLTTGLLTVAAAVLIAYSSIYNFCVVDHFSGPDAVYFPLWTTGQAAEMVARAGGRFAAIERYGPAALVDAVARMPPEAMLLTNVGLVLLYATVATVVPAVLSIWAVREVSSSGGELGRVTGPAAREEPIPDVFLCHNNQDKPAVRSVAASLVLHGLRPWLDQEELRPGDTWPDVLARQLRTARSGAVFIGSHGIGKWQQLEISALLHEAVHRGCKIVPVLLPGAADSGIPVFLRQYNRVDLRQSDATKLAELAAAVRSQQ